MSTITPGHQPEWHAGFEVQTTITLTDPEGLGTCVAELDSHHQADFLHGLAQGWGQHDGPVPQEAYVGQAFQGDDVAAGGVVDLLRRIADQIEEATR